MQAGMLQRSVARSGQDLRSDWLGADDFMLLLAMGPGWADSTTKILGFRLLFCRGSSIAPRLGCHPSRYVQLKPELIIMIFDGRQTGDMVQSILCLGINHVSAKVQFGRMVQSVVSASEWATTYVSF